MEIVTRSVNVRVGMFVIVPRAVAMRGIVVVRMRVYRAIGVTVLVLMAARVLMFVPDSVSVLAAVLVHMHVHRAVRVPMFVDMGMFVTVFLAVVMRMGVAVHGTVGMPVFMRMTSRRLPLHPSLAFSATADRAHLSSPRIAELNGP